MDWQEITKWAGWGYGAFATIMYFMFPGRSKALIDILNDTVDAMEKKTQAQEDELKMQGESIKKLQEHQTENILKIKSIETEKDLLKAILQGRDGDTTRFQKEGFEAMKRVEETHQIVTSLAKAVDTFISTFNKSVTS